MAGASGPLVGGRSKRKASGPPGPEAFGSVTTDRRDAPASVSMTSLGSALRSCGCSPRLAGRVAPVRRRAHSTSAKSSESSATAITDHT